MGVIALIDLGLKIMDKLNLGAEKAIEFYNNVKALHPNDVPELTDAQIIERMKSAFQANADDIKASLEALD